MGKNSRTALQQALTSTANYLNGGIVRGNEGSGQTLSVKELGRMGSERRWVGAPSHAHSVLQNPPDSPPKSALPKLHLGTSFSLSILPLYFQEWVWIPSNFTWPAEITQANAGELGFH